MMIDGLENLSKYKQNSNNKIDKRFKRQKNIDNSLRITGKVRKKECRIILKQILIIPGLLNMMETLFIEVLLLKRLLIIRNIIKYSIKIKNIQLIRIFKRVIETDRKAFQNLRLILKLGFIEKSQTTFNEKNKPSFFKKLYRKCRKSNKTERKH